MKYNIEIISSENKEEFKALLVSYLEQRYKIEGFTHSNNTYMALVKKEEWS